jgi:D-xylose transport system substrate-binding protein
MRWILMSLLVLSGYPAFAKDHKIGFLLSTMQEERYRIDKESFERALKKKGATMLFESSNNDPNLQEEKAKKLFDQGIEVLVIQAVDNQRALSIVKSAKDRKVPVIAYDRLIRSPDLALYVTQDSCKVGRLQAEAAIAAKSGRGNAVICMGQKDNSVADEITRCNEESLKHSDIKVMLKDNHDSWSPEQCEATVLKALKIGPVDIVLANNSGMAAGAVQALKTAGIAGQVFVAGADASTDACIFIKDGVQSFDVLKAISPLAEVAASSAVDIADGKALANSQKNSSGVPTIVTMVEGFDRTTMKKVLTSAYAEGWEKTVKKCGL